jgi:hypothetical protein
MYQFWLTGYSCILLFQAKLQEFLGRSDLDKHLDADEAIVLGASLHAANLSDGIKLNRKLGMIDGSSYGFVFEINGLDYVKDESIDQVLVPRMKKMPIKVNFFANLSLLLLLADKLCLFWKKNLNKLVMCLLFTVVQVHQTY